MNGSMFLLSHRIYYSPQSNCTSALSSTKILVQCVQSFNQLYATTKLTLKSLTACVATLEKLFSAEVHNSVQQIGLLNSSSRTNYVPGFICSQPNLEVCCRSTPPSSAPSCHTRRRRLSCFPHNPYLQKHYTIGIGLIGEVDLANAAEIRFPDSLDDSSSVALKRRRRQMGKVKPTRRRPPSRCNNTPLRACKPSKRRDESHQNLEGVRRRERPPPAAAAARQESAAIHREELAVLCSSPPSD